MPSLGDLFVNIGARTDQIEQALNRTERRLGGFTGGMRTAVKATALLTAGSALAGAAIITHLVNTGRLAIDAQAKLAQSLDGTVGGLRALEMAAGDAGVDAATLAGEMVRLNARLGDAASGSGASYDALKRLGLAAQDFAGLDIDEKTALLADRMQQLGLSGSQAADLMRDLGVRNENLTQLMRSGGDAIRAQAEEVDNLGLRLSMVDAAQVETANDSLGIMGDIVTSIQDSLSVAAAPYITYVGEEIRKAALESGGFKEEIAALVNTIIKGVGQAANVIQGLQIVFKGIEVTVKGFAAGAATAFELVLKGINKLFDESTAKMRKAGEILSYMPGVVGAIGHAIKAANNEATFTGVIEGAESMRQSLFAAQAELQTLLAEPPRGEGVVQFLADIAAASLAQAEATVEARNKILGGGADGGSSMSDEEIAKAQEKLAALQSSWNTELQMLQEKFGQEQEIIAAAREAQLVTKEQYDAMMLEAEGRYQQGTTALTEKAAADRQKIAEIEARSRQDAVGGMFRNLTSLMNSESRKMFEIGKASALAQTVIDTYKGAQSAYSALAGIPVVGPALGAAAAAAAIAAGGMRAQAINSQSFGGGSAAVSNTQAVNNVSTPVGGGASGGGMSSGPTYNLSGIDPGKLYDGRQLISIINEAQEAGAVLKIKDN